MEVRYKNKKLARLCTDKKLAYRIYGDKVAEKLFRHLVTLTLASSIDMLLTNRVARCHPLKGDRDGEYAMDLVGGYRLVFSQHEEYVEVVIITYIGDYH